MERPWEHFRSLWAEAVPHNAPLTRAGAARDAYKQGVKFSLPRPSIRTEWPERPPSRGTHEASVLLLAMCLEDTSFCHRETITSPGVRNAPKRRRRTDRSRERERGKDADELSTRHPSRTVLPSQCRPTLRVSILRSRPCGQHLPEELHVPLRRSQVSDNDNNKKPRLFSQDETITNQPEDLSKLLAALNRQVLPSPLLLRACR